jgi:hypothetical protein
MSDARDPIPSTKELCGSFIDPTNRDSGRSYSAAIKQDCEAPSVTADGEAEIVYVDGEPQALEIEI